MSDSPASPTVENRRRRRGWGQFSLVSLLLLAVVGCLVGAYFGERRQRGEAEERLRAKEAENRQYRIDLGILDDRPNVLTITDPKRIHVCQLPSTDPPMQWRWRLYLPPGKEWRLGTSQGKEWDETGQWFRGSRSGSNFDERGEIILEAQVVRDLEGKAHLKMRWANRGYSMWIPDAGMTMLQTRGKRTIHVAGSPKQQSFPAEGRVELLHWGVELADGASPPGSAVLPGQREPLRGYGISIYLEELNPDDPMHRANRKRPK